jgi:prepilin-type N-terminal cleavage/methylation domain-containing protein/prepilin-type processing-associated H-X9-DG protein
MRTRAFTLLELLVVIAIIGTLTAVLIPSLSQARARAQSVKCLAQVRALELAHFMYISNNAGALVQVDDSGNDQLSWISTLSDYYGKALVCRCPNDDSPHWPGGTPMPDSPPGAPAVYRKTSYGINNYLTSLNVTAPYTRLAKVPRPASTIHFVHMARVGNSAAADHVHPDDWYVASNPQLSPLLAAGEMATNAHGGKPRTWDATSHYGFLDGHVETLRFRDVFTNVNQNHFNPAVTP